MKNKLIKFSCLAIALLLANFTMAHILEGNNKKNNSSTASQRELIKLEEQIDIHLQKLDFVKADQLIEQWKAQSAQDDSDTFYDLLFKVLRGTDHTYVQQRLNDLCASDPDNLIYKYYKGVACLHSNQFKEAERIFGHLKSQPKTSKQFRSLVNAKWENSRNGSIYVAESPVIIKAENDGINSDVDEYACAASSDGRILSFTRFELSDTNSNNASKEVIYEAYFDQHGEMEKQIRLFSVNNQFHYSPLEYSLDQNTLYFFKGESHKNGNIHEAVMEDQIWVEKGVVEGFINSDFWDSDITFSYDGKYAIFSSNRPGGYGGRDLYSAKLQPDGTWGEISNLGASINTEKNEDSPFLRKDDKMLYFSSDGHAGIGGMDVFYSEYKSGTFAYPKNIGYPINTAGDDKYFSVNSTGKRARYSSTIGKESKGGFDIYNIFNEPTCLKNPPDLTILDIKIHGDVNEIDQIKILKDQNQILFEGTLQELQETKSFVLKNGAPYEIKLYGSSDNYSEWLDLSKVNGLYHTEKNISFYGNQNIAVLSDTLIPGAHPNRNRQDYNLSVLHPDNGQLLGLEFEDIPIILTEKNLDRSLSLFGKKYKTSETGVREENSLADGKSREMAESRISAKDTPYFKNFFQFNQVEVSSDKLRLNTFKELIETLQLLTQEESEIWIHLESRASKVPTTRRGGNNKLAYDRGKKFRLLLLDYLDQHQINTNKLKFTYDAKVTGPNYSKKNKINAYIEHQYVAIYLRTNEVK